MKKVAVVIYEGFCMFEFSIALEMLALQKVPTHFFGAEKKPYRSEEGLLSIPDYTLDELNVDEYDALVLTGAMDEEFPIIKNQRMMEIVRQFDEQKKIIAAISIAPIILIRAGIMQQRQYMAGINKLDLIEEGFTMDEMQGMIQWSDCVDKFDDMKFLKDDHILTSVAYGFREWAMELGIMLDIPIYPKTYGLD